MGGSTYSAFNRSVRAETTGYSVKPLNQIFTQNVKREIHASLNPKGVKFRESRDSETHPLTTPIQLYLDVTGSMREIPHEMIKTGLPKLMGTLIQNGVEDASLMFGAIGDHACDNYPLQVGQFESGDAELDMWLTRTYLEGGGGGNEGESYLLAYYFAAHHIKTDAFEKRKQKGFVFTIGDEPPLKNLSISALKEIMGDSATGQATYSIDDLLKAAQIQNHVYHIHVDHRGKGIYGNLNIWKDLLGNNLIVVTDYTTISKVISDIIISKADTPKVNIEPEIKTPNTNQTILL